MRFGLFVLLASWKGYVTRAQLSSTAQWPKAGYNNMHSAQSPYNLTITHESGPAANVMFQTGGGVMSSPAILQDGSIVVGSDDCYIYCITKTGSQLWRFRTLAAVQSSPAIAQDGSIVVGSNDGSIYCLTSMGTIVWQYPTGSGVQSSPAIAQDGSIVIDIFEPRNREDGSIVVGSNDGNVYCLTSTGDVRWTYTAPRGYGLGLDNAVQSSPAIRQDGSIIVGSWDYFILCLSSEGSLIWKYLAVYQVNSSPAIAQDGSIVVGSGNLIYGLTSTGSKLWQHTTGNLVLSSPAIAQDGSIVVGSTDSYLYCLTSAGTLRWKFQTGGGQSSPAIARDGNIVVGGVDSKIYVLGNQPTPSPTVPPTLLPTAAPFMPPALVHFDNQDVLGGSAAVAALVALVLFLIRNGVDKGFSLTRHLPSFLYCGRRKATAEEKMPDGADLANFTPLEVLLPVTLSLTAAVSNIVQIRNFLSSGDELQTDLAIAMIIARLVTALHSMVLLFIALNRESWSRLLVPSHLRSNSSLWFLLGLVMLTETSHIRFFAWRRSDFVDRSRGFPTLFLFKTCLLSSAISSFVQFSLSIARGVNLFSSVSFGLSLMSFLFAISTAAIKLVAEKIQAYDETLLAEQNDLRVVNAVLEGKLEESEAIIVELKREVAMLRGMPQPQSRKSTRLTFTLSSLLSSTRDEIPAAAALGKESEAGMAAFRSSASHESGL